MNIKSHTLTSHYPASSPYVKIERKDEGDAVIQDILRYDAFVAALFKQMPIKLMICHAAMGVAGEAGELADCLKKHVIYEQELNRANLVEELGDIRFYCQAVMNIFGITESEVIQKNADKLSVRYEGLMYSDEAAKERKDKK